MIPTVLLIWPNLSWNKYTTLLSSVCKKKFKYHHFICIFKNMPIREKWWLMVRVVLMRPRTRKGMWPPQSHRVISGRAGQEPKSVTEETRGLSVTLLGSRWSLQINLWGKCLKSKAPPGGWELVEPTLDELDQKMREAETEPHEGKRKVWSLWSIFRIQPQKTHCIFDLF